MYIFNNNFKCAFEYEQLVTDMSRTHAHTNATLKMSTLEKKLRNAFSCNFTACTFLIII